MSRYKEECGCTHDGVHWLIRCATHTAWDAEVSARWLAESKRDPIPTTRLNDKPVLTLEEDWLT